MSEKAGEVDPVQDRRREAGEVAHSSDRRRRWVNRFSRVFGVLHTIGIRTGRAHVLTTLGRRTGQPRSAPVGVVLIRGRRYIFQAYPRAAWVANARAAPTATLANGRHRTTVRLEEVSVEERRPLLLEQVRKEPEIGNLLVKSGLVTDPAPERVAAAAERIAVFRVETV